MEGSSTRRPHCPGASRSPRLRGAGLLLATVVVAAALAEVVAPHGPGDGTLDIPELDLASEHGAGSLDPTFDDDGIAVTEISSFVDVADAEVQTLPDGTQRVLVLEALDAEVWRFHLDGTLDTTFDDDGVLPMPVDVGAMDNTVLATYEDDSGRFVVAGVVEAATTTDPATLGVARFTSGGAPDPGFATDTDTLTTFTGGTEDFTGIDPPCFREHTFDDLADVGVLSTGDIVVTGPGDVQRAPDSLIRGERIGGHAVLASLGPAPGVRFTQAGDPCTTDSDPGAVIVAVDAGGGAVDRAAGTATFSDLTPRSLRVVAGDDVLVGASTPTPQFTAIRYDSALQEDGAFGTGGVADFVTVDSEPETLPLIRQPAGFVAAVARTGPDTWTLARWDDEGDGDGAGGSRTDVTFPAGVTDTRVGDMELGQDESMVAIGHAEGADALAIATFTAEGDHDQLTVVDGPDDPVAGTEGVALVTIGEEDPSLRVAGMAEPEVVGLDNHRLVMLARLGLAGVLDGTFGPDGSGFALHHGGYGEFGSAVTARADGQVFAAGTIPVTGIAAIDPSVGFVLRHQDDGPLDPGFSPSPRAGIRITCDPEDVDCNVADQAVTVGGIALDDEGRAVIAGESQESSGIVHRLLPSPDEDTGDDFDPTFNGDRPFDFSVAVSTDTRTVLTSALRDITVDDSGRLVAVGDAQVETCGPLACFTEPHMVVVRLLEDGSLDPTFGGGAIGPGVATISPDDAPEWQFSGTSVTLDDAGRIVITGWSQASPEFPDGQHLMVARFLPDGGRDATFGSNDHLGDGVRVHTLDAEDPEVESQGHDVTTRGDRVLVAGTREDDISDPGFLLDRSGFVAQFTEDGTRDPSFGTSGIAFPFDATETGDSVGRALAVDAVGNVVAVGGSLDQSTTGEGAPQVDRIDVLVSRLLSTGDLDPTFGTDGLVTTDVGRDTGIDLVAGEQARDVTIDSDGRIVVVGSVLDNRGERVLTARYNPGATTLECFPDPTDLGGVEVGDSNTAGITCTATGGTVVVTDITIDAASEHPGDFGVAPGTCADATLFPDQACDLTITFAPSSEGDRAAGVDIAHSTVTGPLVTSVGLQGRGTGEPGFSATPNPVIFDEQLVGTSSPERTVTVTNVGNLPLTISATTLVGAHPDDYAIAADGCVGSTLAPGATCTVDVTFTPTPGSAVNRPAQLQFTDDAPGSPHMVALQGAIVVAALELDPGEGPIETEVEVTGTGFEPGTPVELSIAGTTVATVPATEVTASGFTATFTVPEGTPGGVQDVVACQQCDASDTVEATAPFEVTPRLFVQPSVSRPGGLVSALGDGFLADTPVTLTWEPGIGTVVVTADAAGEFTVPVLVFRKDILGARELRATISGAEDVVATAPVLAVPGSSQPGDFAVRR